MNFQEKIISIDVLCKQPGRYIGWPTIARAANGDLLTVFSGDRDGHVCMTGKTQMIRSTDNGKTWGKPVTINDTPLDDRDAGIVALGDGTLVISWFISYFHPNDPRWSNRPDREQWWPYIERISKQEQKQWLGEQSLDNPYQWESGHWTRRSTDHGFTWEKPVKVAATAPHGPIELNNGDLLFIGNGRQNREKCIVAEKSHDQGRTWQVAGTINQFVDNHGGYLCEPHAVTTETGRIVAMFRYERSPNAPAADRDYCVLWQAESEDAGATWTTPGPTEVWGKPPHLIKLLDGRLLLTYGHRREPFGERACISHDNGMTWDYENEFVLSNPGCGDLGYPASLEVTDNSIITVYYERDKPSELPCLKATFWQLCR